MIHDGGWLGDQDDVPKSVTDYAALIEETELRRELASFMADLDTTEHPLDPIRTHTYVVCDDSPAFCQAVKVLLQCDKHKVVLGTASNGEQAIKKVLDYQPDMVLLDMHMPVMEGDAVAAALRSLHYDGTIVMLTSDDDPHVAIRAREAGCDYVLLKGELVDAASQILIPRPTLQIH